MSFSDLALPQAMLDNLAALGYETPSPIQAQCIPIILDGKDVLGTAQTGTGKTAAFALPALAKVDPNNPSPQVLVLTPTRELAIQVAEACLTYAKGIKGLNVLSVYGGQSMPIQLKALRRGVQVVVGTPGRIMDHLRRGSLDLKGIKQVVLDEADEMLRMGFIDDVTWILEHAPEQRQVALFSATMPQAIRKLTATYLNNPESVAIQAQSSVVDRIEQCHWVVRGTNKLDALMRFLEVEEFDGLIMFVRTKNSTVELAQKLKARGHAAAPINGDMTQKNREQTIEELKSGKLDILIATDVAARGIDVPRITHVFNYDIPVDPEAYVHRIGRTGRAGRSGKAILFVAPREQRLLKAIERVTQSKIAPIELPSMEAVQAQRLQEFQAQVVEALDHEALAKFSTWAEDLRKQMDLDWPQLAAALALLAQKDSLLLAEPKPEPAYTPRERTNDGERRRTPVDGKPHARKKPFNKEGGYKGKGGGYKGKEGGGYQGKEGGGYQGKEGGGYKGKEGGGYKGKEGGGYKGKEGGGYKGKEGGGYKGKEGGGYKGKEGGGYKGKEGGRDLANNKPARKRSK